jgi:hypothetical protein
MTAITTPEPAPPDSKADSQADALDAPGAQPESPGGEDWDHEPMPTRARRRPVGPFTAVLCALLLAAGAFTGGVLLERRHVPASAAAASFPRPATASAAGATTGGTSGQGSAGAGAGETVGTVALVDGANVYVTETGGTIVKVTTTPQSQITVTSPATAANIKPGDTLTVTGSTGTDGTITATSVRDAGAGVGGAGGRGVGQTGASRPGASGSAAGAATPGG